MLESAVDGALVVPPKPEAVPSAIPTYVSWAGAVLVGLAGLLSFGWGLAEEPPFVDESAYYSQSYFARLFAQRRFDDPAWLEYMGLDLPPLPKYLIGASLRLGGYPLPTPADATAWYGNTHRTFYPAGSDALAWSRAPIAIVGAFGCVALYGIGVLTSGRVVGLLAGLALAVNPLYRMHARRAMSDVPCEAFMLIGLFFALLAWTRWLGGKRWWSAWTGDVLAGVAVGLAVLSKLSGTLSLIVIAAWTVLALAARASAWRKFGKVDSAVLVPLLALFVFVGLNPFLTAHPTRPVSPGIAEIAKLSVLERADMMFRLRLKVAADQQQMFPHNALHDIGEKIHVVAVQGFGRFGPLGPARNDSTIRYDRNQDGGAAAWLPLVLLGAAIAGIRGRSQRRHGSAPTAWAALLYWVVAMAVVTAYLPMAWDRYLLPIQAPSALLAALAVAACASGFRASPSPAEA